VLGRIEDAASGVSRLGAMGAQIDERTSDLSFAFREA
jgi:hypothetical protein